MRWKYIAAAIIGFLLTLATAADVWSELSQNGKTGIVSAISVFFYRYQTIIGGGAALAAAYIAARPVYDQLSEIRLQNKISRLSTINAEILAFSAAYREVLSSANSPLFNQFANLYFRTSGKDIPQEIASILALAMRENHILTSALAAIGDHCVDNKQYYKTIYRARQRTAQFNLQISNVANAIIDLKAGAMSNSATLRSAVDSEVRRAAHIERRRYEVYSAMFRTIKLIRRNKVREAVRISQEIRGLSHAATSASAAMSNSDPLP